MKTLSQNRKIAISTVAVFLASFCFMIVFLAGSDKSAEFGKTDVMSATENNDIVFSTGPEGNFLGASEPFCLLVEKNCTAIKEHRLFDIINSEDLSDFASVHAKLLQEGESVKGLGPFRFKDQNDGYKLLLLDAVPQKEEGKVIRIIFSARDLTEHIKNLSKNSEGEESEVEEEKTAEEDDDSKDSSWLEKFQPKKPPKLLVEKA